MSHRKLILGAFLACLMTTASVQGQETCIDFESSPGLDDQLGTADDILLLESTVIDSQFAPCCGVTFSLVQGGVPVLGGAPFIATQGPPTVGFSGPGDDTPAPSPPNTLTDGSTIVGTAPFGEADIAADFSTPVVSVRLKLIDFLDAGVSPGDQACLIATFQGSEIARDCYTLDGSELDGNVVTLGVSVRGGIDRVELDGTAADIGTAIDDFCFTPCDACQLLILEQLKEIDEKLELHIQAPNQRVGFCSSDCSRCSNASDCAPGELCETPKPPQCP